MSWYLNPLLKNCRRILLKDVQRNVRLGAYEHERVAAQPVIFNIEVFVKTHHENDDLRNAFNYDLVVAAIDEVIEIGHIDLQETLVDQIADKLLIHQEVIAICVRSEKTKAYDRVYSAGIEIFREKSCLKM